MKKFQKKILILSMSCFAMLPFASAEEAAPPPAALPEKPVPMESVIPKEMKETVEKKIIGSVTGVLQEEKSTKLFVSDRESNANTFLVTPETVIKKQIDLQQIQKGEFAGVIYELDGREKLALSTSVGPTEKVELDKEDLLKFAPTPDAPEAPPMPEQPEMPPMPGMPGGEGGEEAPPQEGGAPGDPGAGAAKDKSKEATGFSKEDTEKAKKAKEGGPMDDILKDKGPLSNKGEGIPPDFLSGKVISLDLNEKAPTMVIEDSVTKKQETVLMGPHLQIINRYLEINAVQKGNEVEVTYEAKDKESTATFVLVARDNPEAAAAVPAAP